MIESTATARRTVGAAVPDAVAAGVGPAVWTTEKHAERPQRDHPIFVDSTDRRRRRIRRAANAAAAGCAVFLVVLGASLGVGQRTPMFQLPFTAPDTGATSAEAGPGSEAVRKPALGFGLAQTSRGLWDAPSSGLRSILPPWMLVAVPTTPVTLSTVPGTSGSVPGTPATVLGTPATVPGTPATDLGTPATVPGTPAAGPGAPVTDPGIPATDPGSPAADPGTPATDPGTPATDPGAPATDPGTPATDPGAPATDPGIPSDRGTGTPPTIGAAGNLAEPRPSSTIRPTDATSDLPVRAP